MSERNIYTVSAINFIASTPALCLMEASIYLGQHPEMEMRLGEISFEYIWPDNGGGAGLTLYFSGGTEYG